MDNLSREEFEEIVNRMSRELFPKFYEFSKIYEKQLKNTVVPKMKVIASWNDFYIIRILGKKWINDHIWKETPIAFLYQKGSDERGAIMSEYLLIRGSMKKDRSDALSIEEMEKAFRLPVDKIGPEIETMFSVVDVPEDDTDYIDTDGKRFSL